MTPDNDWIEAIAAGLVFVLLLAAIFLLFALL